VHVVRPLALVPVAIVLVAGCGAETAGKAPPPVRVAKALVARKPCRAREYRPLQSTTTAYAAVVRRSALVHRRPGGTRLARFGSRNANGAATVFGALGAVVTQGCAPTWYRVQLPMRPNGIVGYVRARDVGLLRVRTRIEVDISRRRVTLFRSGKRVLSATAAVGSSATPTPTGRYYVNQRLIPADTSGPFGPGAIGVSAFSNVLTGWTQGGPIAIHGTNRPSSIGQPVSNGCIRLPNPVLRRMFAAALVGTPVVIHP
jgi:lipoprotein-anchoring transpeptidase ErfK/SrfK